MDIQLKEPGYSPDMLERFAQEVAQHGNQSLAYRNVARVAAATHPRSVWQTASAIANLPAVASRIRQLNLERCKNALISAQELVNDWVDIATADPNDIVSHVVNNCRHCRGVDFAYQWRDINEWIDACAKNAEQIPPKNPPEMAGGFGFTPHGAPNEACPHCYGDGVGRTIVADTTKLTGKARKLFKGIRSDKMGNVEVLLHDQEAARQSLGKAMRLLGNDPVPINPVGATDASIIADDVSAVTASAAYLTMVR